MNEVKLQTMEFKDWNTELVARMIEIGETAWDKSPPLIDSRIPYEMGLTPKQTANAFMGWNVKLFRMLCDEERRRNGLGPMPSWE